MDRDALHDSLDAIATALAEQGKTNPIRYDLLLKHLETVHMTVDALLDETPGEL